MMKTIAVQLKGEAAASGGVEFSVVSTTEQDSPEKQSVMGRMSGMIKGGKVQRSSSSISGGGKASPDFDDEEDGDEDDEEEEEVDYLLLPHSGSGTVSKELTEKRLDAWADGRRTLLHIFSSFDFVCWTFEHHHHFACFVRIAWFQSKLASSCSYTCQSVGSENCGFHIWEVWNLHLTARLVLPSDTTCG
jgi:hypothetical protein